MSTPKISKKAGKSKKTIYILIAAVVVLVLVGSLAKSKGWVGGKKAKKVELATVSRTTITELVNASGKVQPVEEVKISPEVSGEITELLVEEGDSVTKGQLLVSIRPDNLKSVLDRTIANLNSQKANLSRAKADSAQSYARFTQAKLNFDRAKELFDKKVTSQQQFDQSDADFKVAKSQLEAARQNVKASEFTVMSSEAAVAESRENLQLTKIYAPMSGIVSRLNVEKGERVVGTQQMAGTELLRIADLSKMEVRVNVNENDIIRVSLNDKAIIDVDSYSYKEVKFEGTVYAIANSANSTAASTDVVTEFEVKILIDPSSYQGLASELKNRYPFRPGMTASVDIVTEKKDNVLSVPLAAVTTRKDDDLWGKDGAKEGGERKEATEKKADGKDEVIREIVFVYNPDDETVGIVDVKTGISDFNNIEVTSGLEEGRVVVKGPFIMVSKQLVHGDKVEKMEGGKTAKRGSD